jgi:large subunit ribosomal protein L15
MDLHNLTPSEGSTKNKKRLGRGNSSGNGRTSGRGHKGYLSRSGAKKRRWFEGGQTPLHMRLPKYGFNNRNKVEYYPINLDLIQMFVEKYGVDTIDEAFLKERRILKKRTKIKILGRGELDAKVQVSAHAYSESAKKAIEDKGGSINLL